MGTMDLPMKSASITYTGLHYKWDGLSPMRISEGVDKKGINGTKWLFNQVGLEISQISKTVLHILLRINILIPMF